MESDEELTLRVSEGGEPQAEGSRWAVAAWDKPSQTMLHLTVVAATKRQARTRADEYLRRIKGLSEFDLMQEVEPV